MRSCVVRFAVPSIALLVACGSEPVALEQGPEPVLYDTPNFLIVDEAGVPVAVIDSLSEALETEWERVGAFLAEFIPPDRITFILRAGDGSPFVTVAANSMSQWVGTLALNYIPHQLAHLWTRYTRRPFLEEGIAVYATEFLMPENRDVHPYRGQVPHAWVALFELNGSTLSLFSAYRARTFVFSFAGSSQDALAWQVFIEAGSFTRWVIDTFGRDVWFELFRSDDLGGTLGGSTAELEDAWFRTVREAYPNQLSCEEALGTVGSREAFWCSRARGQ